MKITLGRPADAIEVANNKRNGKTDFRIMPGIVSRIQVPVKETA